MGCDTGKKKKRMLRAVGTALICAGTVCVALLALAETVVRPTLEKLLDYKCSMAAERIISDAVFACFSPEECGDIVTFTLDGDGRIAALRTDRAKINTLKALLTDAVNDGLVRLGNETVSISAGTLTGISLFYGSGAELVFDIEPRGRANTVLKCSFENAGINQTMHSIILEVEAQITPVMPGFSENITVSYDIILAQTVIVGSVPESYSYIVLDEEHMSELANIDI